MPLVDLKRSKQEKTEEAAETAPTPVSQPDYGYGTLIHLEDHEIEKLGIDPLPGVGDEFHIRAIAKVKGISERDYGDRKEAGIDLQITMMEVGLRESAKEEEGEDETPSAEDAEEQGRGARTVIHSTYRGIR
jgi:hypothetical protein